mmetsp:Transcript_173487/g.550736  ORF Transcript_173487/g.550736 Transcript_173487/m.550736 type:complete len:267 (-) Transcript_173487:2186-2986(-)
MSEASFPNLKTVRKASSTRPEAAELKATARCGNFQSPSAPTTVPAEGSSGHRGSCCNCCCCCCCCCLVSSCACATGGGNFPLASRATRCGGRAPDVEGICPAFAEDGWTDGVTPGTAPCAGDGNGPLEFRKTCSLQEVWLPATSSETLPAADGGNRPAPLGPAGPNCAPIVSAEAAGRPPASSARSQWAIVCVSPSAASAVCVLAPAEPLESNLRGLPSTSLAAPGDAAAADATKCLAPTRPPPAADAPALEDGRREAGDSSEPAP